MENVYLKSIIGSWLACWYNEVVKNIMKTHDQTHESLHLKRAT